MKKFFSFFKRHIIVIPIIYLCIFLASILILAIFDLTYRQGVYLFSVGIIILLSIIGIFQILLKLKRYKVVLIGLFLIFLIIGGQFAFVIFVFCYMPEHIVEKNEKKYVAYVNSFFNTSVNYYEYNGPLVMSIYKAFTEDYGEGGFDPIENKYGYDYPIQQTVYYDAKGNILKHEENKIKADEQTYNYEEKKSKKYFNITTSEGVELHDEPSDCYASTTKEPLVKIISYNQAANIADEEAKNLKYQYQSWKSEFYSRGKDNNEVLDAKLTEGLDEIDRLYYWESEWKIKDYNECLMWQIRLFDENDPLTSLYIYVDAKNGDIVGAGKASD